MQGGRSRSIVKKVVVTKEAVLLKRGAAQKKYEEKILGLQEEVKELEKKKAKLKKTIQDKVDKAVKAAQKEIEADKKALSKRKIKLLDQKARLDGQAEDLVADRTELNKSKKLFSREVRIKTDQNLAEKARLERELGKTQRIRERYLKTEEEMVAQTKALRAQEESLSIEYNEIKALRATLDRERKAVYSLKESTEKERRYIDQTETRIKKERADFTLRLEDYEENKGKLKEDLAKLAFKEISVNKVAEQNKKNAKQNEITVKVINSKAAELKEQEKYIKQQIGKNNRILRRIETIRKEEKKEENK